MATPAPRRRDGIDDPGELSAEVVMELERVRANGIDFAYLERGEGPLMVLLHGFPDNAHTWSRQMPALADAGFHVVAPFSRGFAPSGPGEFYDIATLATDVHALIGALGGAPACVVGHDWAMFAEPGVTAATLSYYRAAFASSLAPADPRVADVRERTLRDIDVPTLAVFGALDPRLAFAATQSEFFTGEYRYEVVAGAEHFVHREQPDLTTKLLLDWFCCRWRQPMRAVHSWQVDHRALMCFSRWTG